jgi:hypothetical protein
MQRQTVDPVRPAEPSSAASGEADGSSARKMTVMVSASGPGWVVHDEMLDAVPIDFSPLLSQTRGRRADLSERDGRPELLIGMQSIKDLRLAGRYRDR